jgi:hypothetical protein
MSSALAFSRLVTLTAGGQCLLRYGREHLCDVAIAFEPDDEALYLCWRNWPVESLEKRQAYT